MNFVEIHPEGVKQEGAKVQRVMFTSVEERDNYVQEEYRYCKVEEQAYLQAFYRKDRERTRAKLLLKRVEFAKKSGKEIVEAA